MKSKIKLQKSFRSKANTVKVLLLSLFFLNGACADFVEVEVPTNQLSAPLIFENNTTATAALVAIYAKIRDNGMLTGNPTGMQAKLGEYADELTFYGTGAQIEASFYNNILLPNNQVVQTWWNSTYNQIYATNALLEGVEKSKALTAVEKNQLEGEALFIRAFLHFNLTNTYGAIPYITSTNYRTNTVIGKTPTKEIYEKIEDDLILSEALLRDEYTSTERTRPNKATMQALLARVYLYGGKWAMAANSASAVLNKESLYQDESDFNTLFLKENKSHIWQLKPANQGGNTLEASTFVFLQGPPPGVALSTDLVNSFEAGDKRRTNWVKEVTNGTDTWYHAFKYKLYDTTAGSVQYSIVFRTAELYLIRAEARARQGELISAIEDLNKIRNKAGLINTTATTQEQIVTAVLKERRNELFTEGHRFFDLKRTHLLNEILPFTKPGWDNNDQVLPLPETELLLNPNLKPQNTGY